jgi:hypothetical protein
MFRRNLIYHIWPTNQNDTWQWNLAHLKRYIDQFDGTRIIAVAEGPGTATLADVKAEFGDYRIDHWLQAQNVHILRECTTFVPMMELLPREKNNITFYAHAKGVRHKHGGLPTIWAHVMYRLLLEFPEKIETALQVYPITGAFKRHNEFRLPHHDIWHYSGTYFWFRNHDVFVDHAEEWRKLHPRFFAAVEAWPSRIFKNKEAHCIFNDHVGDSLYAWHVWNDLLPELKAQFGIEVDIGPKPEPMWKPTVRVG